MGAMSVDPNERDAPDVTASKVLERMPAPRDKESMEYDAIHSVLTWIVTHDAEDDPQALVETCDMFIAEATGLRERIEHAMQFPAEPDISGDGGAA